jgi:hypothetical protein
MSAISSASVPLAHEIAWRPRHLAEPPLQLSDFRPHDVLAVIENAGDGAVQAAPNSRLLRGKVDEGDWRRAFGHGTSGLSHSNRG